MTDPTPDPAPDEAAEVPDTITRHAVFSTTLQQYVGGVTVGAEPKAADIKRELESLGMKGHEYEIRQV